MRDAAGHDPPLREPGPAGVGNEAERLDLLRGHEQRVTAQIGEFTRGLGLITCKAKVYAERPEQRTAERLWSPVAKQAEG